MRDVIEKTLPIDPTRAELRRLAAIWGRDALDAAGVAVGGYKGADWTLDLLARADSQLRAEAAFKQDAAMLERDEPKATPSAPTAEDPLAAVRDALDELIDFAMNDAINAGRALPGGRGCQEPDVSGMQRRIDDVLDEVRKLLATPRLTP